ncbi:ACT domain-containing protein ACR8 [Zea mays]|uniref:ACT domain-containing protein ACR n=1 Tax=Zea mays TaxID=4577 RepID=A0A1D6KTY8_MAIZE|nr:ACT domain-containing protein ACR8 [Zea mays]
MACVRALACAGVRMRRFQVAAWLVVRFGEVAELMDCSYLDIYGRLPAVVLTRATSYAAYLVYGIAEGHRGLSFPDQEAALRFDSILSEVFVSFHEAALADEEAEYSSWDSDDEYQKFIQNMNPPRVTIDNTSCPSATVIHVDSTNKYGILLEVVQVLTDLKLIVTKAYISSDGGWFMDGSGSLDESLPYRSQLMVVSWYHQIRQQKIYKAIKDKGLPVDLVECEGERHGFLKAQLSLYRPQLLAQGNIFQGIRFTRHICNCNNFFCLLLGHPLAQVLADSDLLVLVVGGNGSKEQIIATSYSSRLLDYNTVWRQVSSGMTLIF